MYQQEQNAIVGGDRFQVRKVAHACAIDGRNNVAGTQTTLRRRAAFYHLRDFDAAIASR